MSIDFDRGVNWRLVAVLPTVTFYKLGAGTSLFTIGWGPFYLEWTFLIGRR